MKKIAIPSKGEMIDNHFGHCDAFTVYSLSDENEITETAVFKGPDTCGCKSDLAQDLANDGIEVLLAGGIGQGAINKLKQAGIETFSGFNGTTKDVLNNWINGSKGDSSVCPPHSGDGHNCSH